MCYRVARDFDDADVKGDIDLKVDRTLAEFMPKYNVAITSDIPVIVPGSRVLDLYRWGLIPKWAKDMKIGSKLANARAETVDSKSSFKESFESQRCLVLASGFYEWDSTKQPFYIQVKDRKILAFAGLFSKWKNPVDLQIVKTCTIITTEPNEFMKAIHNRMPVILDPRDYEEWLKGKDLDSVKKLLVSYRGELVKREVDRKVNKVGYERKEILGTG